MANGLEAEVIVRALGIDEHCMPLTRPEAMIEPVDVPAKKLNCLMKLLPERETVAKSFSACSRMWSGTRPLMPPPSMESTCRALRRGFLRTRPLATRSRAVASTVASHCSRSSSERHASCSYTQTVQFSSLHALHVHSSVV